MDKSLVAEGHKIVLLHAYNLRSFRKEEYSGPSCSKLTMSLVNVSLKL